MNNTKKPAVAFTIADANNAWMIPYLKNSLRKFHGEKELPLVIYGQEVLNEIPDPAKFYKATPLFARELSDDYELVLKLDCDQIIMGSLDFILKTKDYQIGTVLNINRVDPPKYGFVTVQGVMPNEYYNAGLVAMRSPEFIEHWWKLCNSKYFDRFQYREQDLLNILCHYGNYKVRCFDHYDKLTNYMGWHGLVAKGEENKMIVKDKKVILPRGKDNYPDRDVEIKIWHSAGGAGEKKLNYRVYFNEDVIQHINWLISDDKKT